jgi:tRNA dimethylallyltransferase
VPRAELHARIDARAAAMFGGGLLDEAHALLARHAGAPPAKLPIGYAEAIAVARGELAVEEAIRRVQVAHRRYARRQVIWLRRERGVEWIAPPFDADALARRVERG